MPVYMFYSRLADGTASSFEPAVFENLSGAADHAQRMLALHLSATHIEVCLDDVQVLSWRRSSQP